MKKSLNLKTIYFLLAMFLVAGSIIFSSCKKSSSTPGVTTTVLADSITSAKTLLANATEGVATGNYQKGSKAVLQATIDAVQAISDDPASTQANIDAAVANLHNAIVLFKTKVIVPIAPESLVAQWTFSEGSGTVAHDASPNKLDGTLMVGHAKTPGGTLPTWTTDRYGDAGKALQFSKGGHIEVPFNTALNPVEMTISLWVKVDSIKADNYIISQNWWVGYKFNLQEANKPFYTFKTSATIYDRDWSVNGLPLNAWHHIVVSCKDGEEDYYADGQIVKSWTDVTGSIATIANAEKFCIGQAEPNSPKVAAADDPAQWGVGYFRGAMDEIRIYNKALTAAQVKSIYDLEKVQ